MSTRGPRLKSPTPRPGSRAITPRIVNVALADDDLIADRDAERGQQLRPHQRRRGLRAARASRSAPPCSVDAAVERKRAAARPAAPPSRATALRPSAGRTIVGVSIDFGALGRRRPRRGGGRSSRAPPASSRGWWRSGRRRRSATCASRAEDAADALDHRAQRDDRGDADRDADEEEQQPLPATRASRAPPSAGRTSSRHRSRSTTRPSRSTSRASAIAASSASCVTSTSVVPRAGVNRRAADP